MRTATRGPGGGVTADDGPNSAADRLAAEQATILRGMPAGLLAAEPGALARHVPFLSAARRRSDLRPYSFAGAGTLGWREGFQLPDRRCAMRALVVYESMFGNTQAVAEAVADGPALADGMDGVGLVEVGVAPAHVDDDVDLLVSALPPTRSA